MMQVVKMVQLHQCAEQRMGVILMGPSGSGKSTLWRTLAAAYGRLGCAPVVFTLNPKAMPRKQVLGYMDADTRWGPCTQFPIEACTAWGLAYMLPLHASPMMRTFEDVPSHLVTAVCDPVHCTR